VKGGGERRKEVGGGRETSTVIGKVVSSFVVITAFAFSFPFSVFRPTKAKTTTAKTNVDCLPMFLFFFGHSHCGLAANSKKNSLLYLKRKGETF